MSSKGATVQVESVSHRFDRSGLVLANIQLKIESGEFVAILGPSGCGKSTLLRLIANLTLPESGAVTLNQSTKSFVFQEATLLPWRTSLENVELPLELQSTNVTDRTRLAKASLAKMKLDDSINKYPQELSGGMKMRVAVARALVTEPSLLLLDEPFAALDESTRHSLQHDLRSRWLTDRSTVIFVTHSVSEAVYLADRIVVLSERPGKVVADYAVNLPKDRNEELRLSIEFLNEVKKVHALIRGNSK